MMKACWFAQISFPVACSAVFAQALVAQNSIQVFGPVDTRVSEVTATYASPVTFDTNNLSLNCPAAPVAVLSSAPSATPLSSTGDVLVDNNITVTVSHSTANGSVTNGPTEVCPASGYAGPAGFPNCFKWAGYGSSATEGYLTGQNPDTFVVPASEGGTGLTVDQAGGVAPIDISSQLAPGAQAVTINLQDEGGYLTSSSLYLNTNCTQGGVTGPALVAGNTIASTPTAQQLTQTFAFNQSTSQQVGFVYDLNGAQTENTLIIDSAGSTPQVADLPINPDKFRANFVPNTSFATSVCLIHSGEVGGPVGGPATQPACKLFTLECTTGTGSATAGANCPVSTVANEVVQDIFDGPNFSLHDIHTPNGRTFHEGIGFLMASEGWGSESSVPPGTWNWNGGSGGPCTFDPAANLNLPCPQNLLTSFTGPGRYSGSGETTHPNSTFISIAQVPEDHTQVKIEGELPGDWVNSDTVNVTFASEPPNLRGTNLPGAAAFIPSPIQSITYGVSPANNVPVPAAEPIAGDVTLTNAACPIPTAANPGAPVAADFVPAAQTLTFSADGRYLLHFYAQDCAGTQELNFQQVGGSWTTNFYTSAINVDTVPPQITGLALTPGPGGSGSYAVGEQVMASYACSDATSGVVVCGKSFYSGGTPSTITLTTLVDTHSAGAKTFTVQAWDAAGNESTASVTYTVVGSRR